MANTPLEDGMVPTEGEGSVQGRWKAEQRLCARILSCGVVPEEQAAALIRAGFQIAAVKAQEGDSRGYARGMSVPIAAAKMEQEERKLPYQKFLTQFVQQNNFVAAPADVVKELAEDEDYVEFQRQRALSRYHVARSASGNGNGRAVGDAPTSSGAGPGIDGGGNGEVRPSNGQDAS